MTAEIAILNRSAVAMAADSAVTMTMGRDVKIFPTANKIFALSNTEPVGIMVYGGADYMGVPWETVIKVLRGRLGGRSFSRLADYAKWFRDSLSSATDLIIGDATNDYVTQCVLSYYEFIHQESEWRKRELSEKQGGKVLQSQVVEVYHKVIATHAAHWKRGKTMPGITGARLAKIRRILKDPVEKLINIAFENMPMPKSVRGDLRFIAEALFTRHATLHRSSDSGVVIAGFGHDDIVPAITAMDIRGIIDGVLQWRQGHEYSMEKMRYGAIIPFAQTDEVQNFLDGVHPDYQGRLDKDFGDILEKATEIIVGEVKGPDPEEKARAKAAASKLLKSEFDAYRRKLRQFRVDQYSMPILQVLDGTPKDQLASMAESLVNLTSFKRRVSMQAETVGGPIDVALISKGDGLVWVKRKHYFPSDLNHQFFSRYNGGLS
jgi:hypothetical protein